MPKPEKRTTTDLNGAPKNLELSLKEAVISTAIPLKIEFDDKVTPDDLKQEIIREDVSKPEITPQVKKPAPLSDIDIRPSLAEKLKKHGITTTGVLATMSAKQLANTVSGVGDTIAQRLVASAREYHGLGVKKARLVYAQQKSRRKISTGLTGLDGILQGGVETGVITEFYGAFNSGKTQLCHQLSVLVQRPVEEGGLDKACAWIDTEGTWYGDRPQAIATRFGMDPDAVLDGIYIARSYNSDEQMALTNQIIEELDEFNVGLIVIDSLIAHFRAEYIGRGTLASRQQTISNYLEMIQRPVSLAGVAVVVTNQVSANPDPYSPGGPERAVGGHVVSHATGHRVYLKGKSKSVTASVIDSPILPQDKCEFTITAGGLEDVK
ncbi:MAG: DNA repair and recombination protein RadA [Candidatus Odinarchaeota archaeon]